MSERTPEELVALFGSPEFKKILRGVAKDIASEIVIETDPILKRLTRRAKQYLKKLFDELDRNEN